MENKTINKRNNIKSANTIKPYYVSQFINDSVNGTH